MKDIRYTQEFVDPLTKEVLKLGDKNLNLQHILYQCAVMPAQGDENLPVEKKMKLHAAAMKIANMKPLKAEALLLLKERGGKFLSILAYGFVCTELAHSLEEPVDDSSN